MKMKLDKKAPHLPESKRFPLISVAFTCAILLLPLTACGAGEKDKTAWFAGKWGVMAHFLASPAGTVPEAADPQDWFDQINNFDVDGLAEQLEEIGADYFIITVGQGAGYFLSPNSTYDQLLGPDISRCPDRDLVMEMADALNPRGIKLIVYTASELGWGDHKTREALEMTSHHNDHRMGLREKDVPNDWHANRKGQIKYLGHWIEIHKEWSQRWGDKVAGWWVDGCYQKDIRFPEDQPPNLETMKEALLTGNPNSIVAFNGGKAVRVNSKHEDYTAGEVSDISRDFPENPVTWFEKDGHKLRLHVLTYLGEHWGSGSPRFTDDEAADFARSITAAGGFVSFDIPPQKNGLIPEAFIQQLKHIGQAIEK